MKVAKLEGALLDYWVARANGWTFGPPHKKHEWDVWRDGSGEIVGTIPAQSYQPSADWAQGGRIIERELISTEGTFNGWGTVFWIAKVTPSGKPMQGCTPLIAAMRAFVASKFGDEVADETKWLDFRKTQL